MDINDFAAESTFTLNNATSFLSNRAEYYLLQFEQHFKRFLFSSPEFLIGLINKNDKKSREKIHTKRLIKFFSEAINS